MKFNGYNFVLLMLACIVFQLFARSIRMHEIWVFMGCGAIGFFFPYKVFDKKKDDEEKK